MQTSTYVLKITGKPTLPTKLTPSLVSGCDILILQNCHFLPSLFLGVNQLIFSIQNQGKSWKQITPESWPGWGFVPYQPYLVLTSPPTISHQVSYWQTPAISPPGTSLIMEISLWWAATHPSGYSWCSKQKEKNNNQKNPQKTAHTEKQWSHLRAKGPRRDPKGQVLHSVGTRETTRLLGRNQLLAGC